MVIFEMRLVVWLAFIALFFIAFGTSPWFYVGLLIFLAVLFAISFYKSSRNKARCEEDLLDEQAKNPWQPYLGEPVAADMKVNIELKNGSMLWRVPGSKLHEMADNVKLWMPSPLKPTN